MLKIFALVIALFMTSITTIITFTLAQQQNTTTALASTTTTTTVLLPETTAESTTTVGTTTAPQTTAATTQTNTPSNNNQNQNLKHWIVDTFSAVGTAALNSSVGLIDNAPSVADSVGTYRIIDDTPGSKGRPIVDPDFEGRAAPDWVCSNVFMKNQMTPSYVSNAYNLYKDGFSKPPAKEEIYGVFDWNRTSFGICLSPHWMNVTTNFSTNNNNNNNNQRQFWQLCFDLLTFNRTGSPQVLQLVCPSSSILNISSSQAKLLNFNYVVDKIEQRRVNFQLSPAPRRYYSDTCNENTTLDVFVTTHLESVDSVNQMFYYGSFSGQLRVGIPQCAASPNFTNNKTLSNVVTSIDTTISASFVSLDGQFILQERVDDSSSSSSSNRQTGNGNQNIPTTNDIVSGSSIYTKVSSEHLQGDCFSSLTDNFGFVTLMIVPSADGTTYPIKLSASTTQNTVNGLIELETTTTATTQQSVVSLSRPFSVIDHHQSGGSGSSILFSAIVTNDTTSSPSSSVLVDLLFCIVSLSEAGCPYTTTSSQNIDLASLKSFTKCRNANPSPIQVSSLAEARLQTISPPSTAFNYTSSFSTVIIHAGNDLPMSFFTFNPQSIANEIFQQQQNNQMLVLSASSFKFAPWTVALSSSSRTLLGILPDPHAGQTTSWTHKTNEDVTTEHMTSDRILPPLPDSDFLKNNNDNETITDFIGNHTCSAFAIFLSSSSSSPSSSSASTSTTTTLEIFRLCDGFNITALAQSQQNQYQRCNLELSTDILPNFTISAGTRMISAAAKPFATSVVEFNRNPAFELNLLLTPPSSLLPQLFFFKIIFDPLENSVFVPSTTKNRGRVYFPPNPTPPSPDYGTARQEDIACSFLVSDLSKMNNVGAPPAWPIRLVQITPENMKFFQDTKNQFDLKIVKVLSAEASYSSCFDPYTVNPKWCAVNLKVAAYNTKYTNKYDPSSDPLNSYVVIVEAVLHPDLGTFEIRRPIFDLTWQDHWDNFGTDFSYTLVPTLSRYIASITLNKVNVSIVSYFPQEILTNSLVAPSYIPNQTSSLVDISNNNNNNNNNSSAVFVTNTGPVPKCYTSSFNGNSVCLQNIRGQYFFAFFLGISSSDPMRALLQYRSNLIVISRRDCSGPPFLVQPSTADSATFVCIGQKQLPGSTKVVDAITIISFNAFTGHALARLDTHAPEHNMFELKENNEKEIKAYYLGEDCMVFVVSNSATAFDRLAFGYSCGKLTEINWKYFEGPEHGIYYDHENILDNWQQNFLYRTPGADAAPYGLRFLLDHGFVFYAILKSDDSSTMQFFDLSDPPILPPDNTENCSAMNVSTDTSQPRGGSWNQFVPDQDDDIFVVDGIMLFFDCWAWNTTSNSAFVKRYITFDTLKIDPSVGNGEGTFSVDRNQLFSDVSGLTQDQKRRIVKSIPDAMSQRIYLFTNDDQIFSINIDVPNKPQDEPAALLWTYTNPLRYNNSNNNNNNNNNINTSPITTTRPDNTTVIPTVASNNFLTLSSYGLLLYGIGNGDIEAIDVYSGKVKWTIPKQDFALYSKVFAESPLYNSQVGLHDSGVLDVFRGVFVTLNSSRGTMLMRRASDGKVMGELALPVDFATPVWSFDNAAISSSWIWSGDVLFKMVQLDLKLSEMFDLPSILVKFLDPIRDEIWVDSVFSFVRSLSVLPDSWRRYNYYSDWEFVNCSIIATNASFYFKPSDVSGMKYPYLHPQDQNFHVKDTPGICLSANMTLDAFTNHYVLDFILYRHEQIVASLLDFVVPSGVIKGFFDFRMFERISDDTFIATPRFRTLNLAFSELSFPGLQRIRPAPGFLDYLWLQKIVEQERDVIWKTFFPNLTRTQALEKQYGMNSDQYNPFLRIRPTVFNISNSASALSYVGGVMSINYLHNIMLLDVSETATRVALYEPRMYVDPNTDDYVRGKEDPFYTRMQPPLLTHLNVTGCILLETDWDDQPIPFEQDGFFVAYPYVHEFIAHESEFDSTTFLRTYNSSVFPKYLSVLDLERNYLMEGTIPEYVWPALRILKLGRTSVSKNDVSISLSLLHHHFETISVQFPEGELLEEFHLDVLSDNLDGMISLLDSEGSLRPLLPRLRKINLQRTDKVIGIVDLRQSTTNYTAEFAKLNGAPLPASVAASLRNLPENKNIEIDLRGITTMKSDPTSLQVVCPILLPPSVIGADTNNNNNKSDQILQQHNRYQVQDANVSILWTLENGTEIRYTCPKHRPLRFPSWNERVSSNLNVTFMSPFSFTSFGKNQKEDAAPYDKFCAPHTPSLEDLANRTLPTTSTSSHNGSGTPLFDRYAQDVIVDTSKPMTRSIAEAPFRSTILITSPRNNQNRSVKNTDITMCKIPIFWLENNIGLNYSTLNVFSPAITQLIKPCDSSYVDIRKEAHSKKYFKNHDFSVIQISDAKNWALCFDALKTWPDSELHENGTYGNGTNPVCNGALAVFGAEKCSLTAMMDYKPQWGSVCFNGFSENSPTRVKIDIVNPINGTTKIKISRHQQVRNKIFGCNFDYSLSVLPDGTIFPGSSLYNTNLPCLDLSGKETFNKLTYIRDIQQKDAPPTFTLSIVDSDSGALLERQFVSTLCNDFPDLSALVCSPQQTLVPSADHAPVGIPQRDYARVRFTQWPSTYIKADARSVLWKGCKRDSGRSIGFADVGRCYPLSRMYPDTYNTLADDPNPNNTDDTANCLSSCSVENEWLTDNVKAGQTILNCTQTAGQLSSALRCLLGSTKRNPDILTRAMIDNVLISATRNEKVLYCLNASGSKEDILHDINYIASWMRVVLSLPMDQIGFKALVDDRATAAGGNEIYFQTCVPDTALANADSPITNYPSVVSSAEFQWNIYRNSVVVTSNDTIINNTSSSTPSSTSAASNNNNNNDNNAFPPNEFLNALKNITVRELLEAKNTKYSNDNPAEKAAVAEFDFKGLFRVETSGVDQKVCADEVFFQITPCAPFLLPNSYAAPVLLLVVATLKDVIIMIIGFTILDHKAVRAFSTKIIANIVVRIYPFTAKESSEWAVKAMSRLDPRRVELDSFWETMIRFFPTSKLKDEWETAWANSYTAYLVNGGSQRVVPDQDSEVQKQALKRLGVAGKVFASPEEAKELENDPAKNRNPNAPSPSNAMRLPISITCAQLKLQLESAEKMKMSNNDVPTEINYQQRRRFPSSISTNTAADQEMNTVFTPREGGDNNNNNNNNNMKDDQESVATTAPAARNDDNNNKSAASTASSPTSMEKGAVPLLAQPTDQEHLINDENNQNNKNSNNNKKIGGKKKRVFDDDEDFEGNHHTASSFMTPSILGELHNDSDDDEHDGSSTQAAAPNSNKDKNKTNFASSSTSNQIPTGTYHFDSGFAFYDDLKVGDVKHSSEAEIALFTLFMRHVCENRTCLILNPEDCQELFVEWLQEIMHSDGIDSGINNKTGGHASSSSSSLSSLTKAVEEPFTNDENKNRTNGSGRNSDDDNDALARLFFDQRELTSSEIMKLQALMDKATTEKVVVALDLWKLKLTPGFFLLVLSMIFAFVNLVTLIAHTMQLNDQLSSWNLYQAIFFVFVNSGASVGILNNAIMRKVVFGASRFAVDPYVLAAFLLNSCPLITHILPAAFMFAWLWISVLIVCVCVYRFAFVPFLRKLERDAASQSTLSSQRFFYSACWRNLMVFVANVVMVSLFNYQLLFYLQESGHLHLGGYWGIPVYEFTSRSLTCSLVAVSESIANVLQLLSGAI